MCIISLFTHFVNNFLTENRFVDSCAFLCYSFSEYVEKRVFFLSNERKAGLDIIRTIAIFAIMLIHMLGHTGVLGMDLRSAGWTGYVFIRYAVRAGVPLFVLLTGYLQSSREFNKKHYTSIIPVLLSYFVISFAMAMGRIYMGENIEPYTLIVNILDFEYGYAWYVEMYIGLFLLIPFLNIMYKNIDKNKKLWLIGILSFLSFMPSALQYMTVKGMAFEILPDYFKNFYVFAFYFIGAYIAEYKPKPNKILCFGIMMFVLVSETALCYCFSKAEYAWWLFNNEASFPHALVAVCMFLLLYNVNAPAVISFPAKFVACCSFEMYLLSYMTDFLCYKYLQIPIWQILIIDFLMVLIGAYIIRLITVPIGNGLKKAMLKA